MDAMTNREIEFAEDLAYFGTRLRKLMTRKEIQLAERLVQRGIVVKRRSGVLVQYYADLDTLYEALEDQHMIQLATRATHGRA